MTRSPLTLDGGRTRLAQLGARDDLLAVADYWPDLRARLGGRGGNALTGMPTSHGAAPLPVDVGVMDLTDEISYYVTAWTVAITDRAGHVNATTTAGRIRQVAYELWRTMDREERADHIWTIASDLRHRAETILGARTRAAWCGPCPTPGCTAEVYLHDDQQARVCPGCGADITRDDQQAYLREQLDGCLLTLSELTSALVVVGTPVPYRTLQSWARRGRLPEHVEWVGWAGVPWAPPVPDTGLFPFTVAFELAAARHGTVATLAA